VCVCVCVCVCGKGEERGAFKVCCRRKQAKRSLKTTTESWWVPAHAPRVVFLWEEFSCDIVVYAANGLRWFTRVCGCRFVSE
jgi:hypothetical protein